MNNKQIAEVFEEMGNILDISGADFFRVNAYRSAVNNIISMPKELKNLVDENYDLKKLPGIGEGIAKKIVELVHTGKCQEHEKMKEGFETGLLEILKLRGVGPKKVKLFYSQLGIKDLKSLKKAAKSQQLRELEGMGEKSENEILRSIEEFGQFESQRILIDEAMQQAERIIDYMKGCKEVKKIEYAGSLRRNKDTIGDIDILVTAKDGEKTHKKVMDHFVNFPESLKTVAEGNTKSTILVRSGIDVDLRVVDDESFGAALHYFTGNKAHNIRIRDLAKKKGLKVSEYGVFKGKKMIGGKTEEEVFASVGLAYIIPQIRRNEGEIEYGLKEKKFPKFLELKDLKGDLHCHSNFSDGRNSLEQMAKAYLEKGFEYFAITDHSSVVAAAGGMGKNDIKKQWKEVDKINKSLKGKLRILKGVEVDILKNGDLDFTDEVLKQLDIVVISAHLYHKLPQKQQTERLIAAIENPYSNILAHPSGRLINKRVPMEFDMERIIKACVENKVAIEINSNPQRLDLAYNYVKTAKGMGAKFMIDSDAHSIEGIDLLKYGVGVARRGWLERQDVLNAKPLESLTKFWR